MPTLARLTALSLLFACSTATPVVSTPPPEPPAPVAPPEAVAPQVLTPAAIVAAADRTEADRALDAGRHPAEFLALLDLEPGARVADLMAGSGYTTELLARAVGPEGVVYGQNSPWALERFAEGPWSARLERPVNANVQRMDRELEDPLGEVKDLDAVTLVLFYHDAIWLETDRAAMNEAVFEALKPGGAYLVIDHAAAEGAGTDVARSLHRIEESVVREEVQAAGFELAGSADFLRNPEDAHDWNASPGAAGDKRGTSDRFVLVFRKPAG